MSAAVSLWRRDASRKELRDFGLIVGGVLALVSAWGVYRDPRSAYGYALAGALALVALGLFLPRPLKLGYQLWMALGFVLGVVMTRVVLTVTFFTAVTLVGLGLKLGRRDPLELRWPGREKTYWRNRERRRPDHYERPY